jgi:signal transduction histidine kinase/CheY-like chemotaxis protein
VALKDELMRLENDVLVPYLLADGSAVKLAWVNHLLVAPDDSVWAATERGVFQIKDGRVIDWCETSGLPGGRYHFLCLMDDGAVWAAQKHGIARLKNGAMVMVTRAHGLHDAGPYALVPDLHGHVWMDSNSGIFRVSAAELNAVADGRLPRLTARVFDGPESARTTDKIVQDYSGCRTGDGHIWFPTSKGLLRVDPSRIRTNTTPPRASIVAWRINGRTQDLNATAADVQPGAGNVEIDYSALEYQAPQKVQYRYRLLGLQDTWFEAGTRRSAFYPSLRPGNYVFEVQARNADSEWSAASASLPIAIPPRFFETLAFRITCIGGLAGVGLYLAWVFHMHRRQKELERTHALMERKVLERTSELAEANSHLRVEIEQRKQAQAETERLHDELRTTARIAQEAARAKSQFLANMSYEIRTPMNGVIGMSNLLLHTALDPQQRELAETTRNSAEALLTVLNDILDFSKVEAGKLVFEHLEFDLREAVEESAELLAVRASAKGVELATFLAPDLTPRWYGDPARLRQVLLNLIGNAVKFTEKGRIVVRVSLEAAAETAGRGGVRFEIADSGIGIAAEAQQKLFQPFTQADDSTTRRFGGTGLGLAISRQIVEHMGGRIGMSSTVGEGSTFWFSVPLTPAAAADYVSAEDRTALGSLRIAAAFPDSELMQEVLEHQARCLGFRLTVLQDLGSVQARLDEERSRGDPFHVVLVGSKDAPLARTVAASLNARGQTSAIAVCAHPVEPDGEGASGASLFNLSPPVRTRALVRALIAAGAAPAAAVQLTATPAPLGSRTPLAQVFRDLRIVVAEDNPVNQRVVELQLRKLGCTARIVGNGAQVLETLRAAPADVVLMDCQMPVMDGYEATRELRNHPAWSAVYVIAMTANSMEGDREKCLAAGMNDYLAKPTRERDLIEALQRAAAAHRTTPLP